MLFLDNNQQKSEAENWMFFELFPSAIVSEFAFQPWFSRRLLGDKFQFISSISPSEECFGCKNWTCDVCAVECPHLNLSRVDFMSNMSVCLRGCMCAVCMVCLALGVWCGNIANRYIHSESLLVLRQSCCVYAPCRRSVFLRRWTQWNGKNK